MKRLIVTVACLAFLAGSASVLAEPGKDPTASSTPVARPGMLRAAASPATNQEQVLIDFDVYRILGNLSGETSVTTGLPASIAREQGSVKDPFVLFNLAKLTVAGIEFRADETAWTWDGKDRPPSGKRVEMISSPRVVVLLNHSFEISIGSQQPVEYFEKRPDGLFELKRGNEQTGLSISANVAQGESGKLLLRDLTIRLQSIEKREPIEGVSLDVGRPIVKTQESVATVAVKQGASWGIVLGTEGYGWLLLRLRVQVVCPSETHALLHTSVTHQ